MIYTVTFNPAVDYIMRTDEFVSGKTNRSFKEEIYFGGKGINVSVVLKELEIDSVAMGYVAGFTGEAIEKGIREKGIITDFVHLTDGFSRINVKIKSGEETELNGQGPDVPKEAAEELFSKLDGLNCGDTVILAGSVPKSMPQDTYEKIMQRFSGRGIRFVVDATGELLLNVLKYKPFLIKPNNQELSEIFGCDIKSAEDVVKYAKELKGMGAVNVLVSLGKDGAVLVDEMGNVHVEKAISGTLINSVGAGDSMVAGFLAGYTCTKNYEYALKLGIASGSATAFSEDLAKKEDIMNLMRKNFSCDIDF